MKHTKGPWNIDGDDIYWKNQHGVKFVIASTVDCLDPKHNSTLIAAAPEMLEALEFIVSEQHLEPNLVSLIEALEATSRGKKAIALINSAIKKAKGEV